MNHFVSRVCIHQEECQRFFKANSTRSQLALGVLLSANIERIYFMNLFKFLAENFLLPKSYSQTEIHIFQPC